MCKYTFIEVGALGGKYLKLCSEYCSQIIAEVTLLFIMLHIIVTEYMSKVALTQEF